MDRSQILSCDWGTSSFRLRLVDTASANILAQISSDQGNARIFKQWKGHTSLPPRVPYYLNVIHENIRKLREEYGGDFHPRAVVLSGMASSSVGMEELPYGTLPADIDGENWYIKQYSLTEYFPYPVLMISGLKNKDDVMRGEETQLLGMGMYLDKEPATVILPGTHSKHVRIENRKITGFKTYLTGEMFDLLSRHSILAASVQSSEEHPEAFDQAFTEGVLKAADEELLHTVFSVRVGEILGQRTKEENYFYLSGILIGSELRHLKQDSEGAILLMAGGHLLSLYQRALGSLDLLSQTQVIPAREADQLIVRGHLRIFEKANT